MTHLTDKILNYYEARAAYDTAKALSDSAHKDMKRAENDVIDAMLDEGTRSVGLDDGTSCSLRKQFTISVTKDNFHAIRTWLMDTVGDDKDFVEEVVSKPALLDFIRAAVDAGKLDEEAVPPFLNLNTRPTVNVRGWSKRDTTTFEEMP
jgi:hypothetical protein